MINHLFRSALTRNTQAFSYLTHVGASRGLLEHNIGQVKNIAPEFQGGVKDFSSCSIIGKMSGVSRGLLERKVGSPFLARWKSTKAEFKNNRPLKQLTLGKGKTGGRNSQGRITSFHRGGGSKRLQRRIDLKRSTSSLGVIERIEYDPNRSSRIALVRWEKGVQLNRQRICKPIDEFALPHKILEPTMTTIESPFSFSSLPGNVDQRKVACFSAAPMAVSAVIGLPKIPCSNKGGGSRKCSAKDVFLSTLCSPKAKADSASLPFGSSIPRIVVAGAKPAFFAVRMKEDVGGTNKFSPWEIRRLERHTLGEDRIKRKAAVSWQTFGRQENLGPVGAAEQNKSKLKMDQVSLPANPIGKEPKEGLWQDDRAPVSYIIASKDLKVGQMVMNCDLSKSD